MNGMNTMNHEITLSPLSHKFCRMNKNTSITKNLKKAVTWSLLNMSIMIWIIENPKYKRAGGHSAFTRGIRMEVVHLM